MRSAILFASILSLAPQLLLEADKGGKSGGTADKSPVDELKDLQAKHGAQASELTTAKDTITSLNKDLASARTKAGEDATALKTANDRIAALENDLKAANDKVGTLEKESKTSDEKAREIAAANGITPQPKSTAKLAAGSKDLKATWDEYVSLSGRAKAAFFREHEKDLSAYAAQCEREA